MEPVTLNSTLQPAGMGSLRAATGSSEAAAAAAASLPLLGVLGLSAGQEDVPAAASPCLASVCRAGAKLCGQSLLCFRGRGALSRYLWKK